MWIQYFNKTEDLPFKYGVKIFPNLIPSITQNKTANITRNFSECLKFFQTICKVLRVFNNFPECPDTFQITWKQRRHVFIFSKFLWKCSKYFSKRLCQTIFQIMWKTRQNFGTGSFRLTFFVFFLPKTCRPRKLSW